MGLTSLPSSITSPSPRTVLATTAVLSASLGALSLFSYQALRRSTRREALRKSVKRSVGRQSSWFGDDRDLSGVLPDDVGADGAGDGEAVGLGMEGSGSGDKREEGLGRQGGRRRDRPYSEELIREQVRPSVQNRQQKLMMGLVVTELRLPGRGGHGQGPRRARRRRRVRWRGQLGSPDAPSIVRVKPDVFTDLWLILSDRSGVSRLTLIDVGTPSARRLFAGSLTLCMTSV